MMNRPSIIRIASSLLAISAPWAAAQNAAAPRDQQPALTVSGKIVIGGHETPYMIHQLPPSSFPALPRAVQDELNKRGCMIPQTYESHRPENVIHANLQGLGRDDWAMLCAVRGTVSLLVFFDGNLQAAVLAQAPVTERLQTHDVTGVLGFNWAIDPATPKQVAEAQHGMSPRPAVLDHDALADTIVEHKTIYHFYAKSAWTLVKLPD
jgi:hypothetical protein